MKKTLFVLFTVLLLVNCKEKPEKAEPADTEAVAASTQSSTKLHKGCYTYEGNGSKIVFEITETGTPVIGNLTYALAEKDKNTGVFKGTLERDKLIGDYTFQSEGTESTREIAFQLKGNQLIEGYGELANEGTTFANHGAIDYSSTMPLTQTECAN